MRRRQAKSIVNQYDKLKPKVDELREEYLDLRAPVVEVGEEIRRYLNQDATVEKRIEQLSEEITNLKNRRREFSDIVANLEHEKAMKHAIAEAARVRLNKQEHALNRLEKKIDEARAVLEPPADDESERPIDGTPADPEIADVDATAEEPEDPDLILADKLIRKRGFKPLDTRGMRKKPMRAPGVPSLAARLARRR